MATLSKADLLKRDNVSVFVKRVNEGGQFKIRDDNSDMFEADGQVTFTQNNKTFRFRGDLSEDVLRTFLASSKGSDRLQINLKTKGFQSLTALYKDKDFGGVAGKASGQGSERQEEGLIIAINEAASNNSKLTTPSLPRMKLLKAYKKTGLSLIGQEPYIDIFVETRDGKKLGVSCKGESAPSLAGGGLGGLNVVVPDLVKKMYATIEKTLKNEYAIPERGVVDADQIPDFYIPIPSDFVEAILKGNEKMGGPIDYMYIGKMDVTSEVRGDSLELNGKFFSIADYLNKVPNFYFRVRKRDIDSSNQIRVTYEETNREGFPKLFMSPVSGKNNLRIVIVDKVPSTGKVLEI